MYRQLFCLNSLLSFLLYMYELTTMGVILSVVINYSYSLKRETYHVKIKQFKCDILNVSQQIIILFYAVTNSNGINENFI